MSYTSRITSLIALLSASSLLGQTASAQSFTVPSGETRTITQFMTTDGDVGIVEAGGGISMTGVGEHGIYSTGDNVLIVQNGTISTMGLAADGIWSRGANALIIQNGTISTTGGNAYGIHSAGAGAWIVQNGTISTTGGDAYGIHSTGAGARIVQNGTIGTTGDYVYGILSRGANALIIQNGTIGTTGDGAYGIVSTGANAWIVQNGTISTSGNSADGIFSFDANARITNSGLIRATGSGANAVRIGPGASSNILTLLPGARLEGTVHVDAAAAGSLTVNIEGGQSSVIRFVEAMPGTVRASSDVAYAVDPAGMQLLAADVTMQQAAGARFGDLIGATFAILKARGAAGSSAAIPGGFTPLAYVAAPDRADAIFAGFDAPPAAAATTIWARGFGSLSAEATAVAGRDHLYGFGGLVVGADTQLSPDWTMGLFAGASRGQARVGDDRLDDTTLFGGAYGRGVFGDTALDVALALGGSYYDSARAVSTVGGMQTASAGYGGLFIAPELGLTHRLDAGGQVVEVGGSLRYAGLFLDGYAETGSLGNLTVDARAIHRLSARAQIAVPLEARHDDGGLTLVTPRLGAEAASQFGADTATGAIAGNATRFSTGNGESLLGFAGLRLEHETAGGFSFSGDIEAVLGQNGSTGILASAGIRAGF